MQTQKSTQLRKFYLLILVHAKIMLAACACACSHTGKRIPGSGEKSGVEKCSASLNGKHSLEGKWSIKE